MEKGAIDELQELIQDLHEGMLGLAINQSNIISTLNKLVDITGGLTDVFKIIAPRINTIESKLDRVLAYVDKVDSEAYRNNEDAKQMVMNIIADVFADGRLKPNNFNR